MNRFGYNKPMTGPQRGAVRTSAPAVKTIPFDYAFQFALAGTRGNKVQDVVEITTEGVFVALSVGYSMVLDEQRTPRTFPPVIDQNTVIQEPSLVALLPDPDSDTENDITSLFINGSPNAEIAVVLLDEPTVVVPITQISLPAIITSGRIRPDGTLLLDLTRDLVPGSQILVWDRTNNLFSQPFQVGFQEIEGDPSTPVIGPDPNTKKMPAAGANLVHIYGSRLRLVDLTIFKGDGSTPVSRPAIELGDRFTFGTDASTFGSAVDLGDDRLAAGDLLILGVSADSPGGRPDVAFSAFAIPRLRLSNIPLGGLAAGLERVGFDLTRGFRLSRNFADLFAADLPLDRIAQARFDRAFEVGSVAAEEVSFLYSLDVGNTGREYQSEPIHNIAGLGIANGDRPFRAFTKPIMFEPRSFIRFQIEELSGPPGTLFIVLQGYKMLGTSRIPG